MEHEMLPECQGAFNSIRESLDALKESHHDMLVNHVGHIEEDVSDIKTDMTKLTVNYDWLKWLYVTLAAAIIAGVVAIVVRAL